LITVLTGLSDEASIIGPSSDAMTVLCGKAQRDKLNELTPASTTGLVSFGLGGGLSPRLQVADLVFGTKVTDGIDTFQADQDWFFRMAGRLTFPHHGAPAYSSGEIAGDTPAERHRIFSATRAWTVDDESLAVAQLAKARNIPFAVVRTISDDYLETVPPAIKNATNPDGSSDVDAVLKSLAEDPSQIFDLVKVAINFERALGTLRGVWRVLQPTFLIPTAMA
jgi:adenosylhomocysteine nucleosidase